MYTGEGGRDLSLIHVDYDNARRQAQKLQAAADECDEIVRKLKARMGQVPNYWEGESAEAFINSAQARIREIQSMKGNIETVAAHIRRVADELERKEKELAAAAAAMGPAAVGGGNGGAGGRSGGGF